MLLSAKELIERDRSTVLLSLKQFYIRRSLRIFPAFYLVVMVAWFAGVPEVASPIWWHLTYTTNVLFVRQGYLDAHTAHLWSLAVEEQFYLVWPFVVLLIPRWALLRITVALVIAAPIVRAAVVLLELDGGTFFFLPIGVMDSLGSGALLALLRPTKWYRRFCALGLVSLVVAVTLAVSRRIDPVFFDTVLSLGFSWLVAKAFDGFQGLTGQILELAPIRYLGKISYGIYLYQGFVPLLLSSSLGYFAISMNLAPSGQFFVLASFVTIVLASLSWYLYEKHWNALKDRFSDSFSNAVTAEFATDPHGH
jgi:peptidoglycan/LPS O-acetylase OafA/YrhL